MTNFTIWRSLIDGLEPGAIPDDLEYRWTTPIDGLSSNDSVSTWPEEIQGEDIDGDNLTYDETVMDDTPGVRNDGSGFGTADTNVLLDVINDSHAIEFSFRKGEWDSGNTYIFGVDGDSGSDESYTFADNTGEGIRMFLADSSDNRSVVDLDLSNFDDGDPHLLTVNINDISDPSNWDAYVDTNTVNMSVRDDDNMNSIQDFNGVDISFFARSRPSGTVGDSPSDIDIGEFSIYSDTRDSNERQNSFDNQLWS